MSDQTVKVTRKGQVTIPALYRKRLQIHRGTRLLVSQSEDVIILKPVPDIEDLAGIHAGEVPLEEMRKGLDDMRRKDRY